MEMTAARMRADLAETPDFMLGLMFMKVTSEVDHLRECRECRKKRGPEYFATAVLHLALIEEEIEKRNIEVQVLSIARARTRYFAAANPSRN